MIRHIFARAGLQRRCSGAAKAPRTPRRRQALKRGSGTFSLLAVPWRSWRLGGSASEKLVMNNTPRSLEREPPERSQILVRRQQPGRDALLAEMQPVAR